MPLHVSSTHAHHQEFKIALNSLWYHHTYRCDDTRGCVMQFWPPDTYRCDDTRGCVMEFWPPDDEHVCSKHVEAWNKLIVKQNFCASSWLITEIKTCMCWMAFRNWIRSRMLQLRLRCHRSFVMRSGQNSWLSIRNALDSGIWKHCAVAWPFKIPSPKKNERK